MISRRSYLQCVLFLSYCWVFVLPGNSDIQLLVFVSDSDGLRPVLNTVAYMNSSWIQQRVDYSTNGPYQVPFDNNNKLMSFLFCFGFVFFLPIIVIPHSLFYKPTVAVTEKPSLWMTSTSWGISLVMNSPQPPPLTLPPRPIPRHLPWTVLLKKVRFIFKC